MDAVTTIEGRPDNVGEMAKIGILVASDRASSNEYQDEGGPAMIELADIVGCNVVVTTGGTGPADRDVTPEATENVVERLMPGFGEQMRAISLKYTPTAILSRQTAGIRGSCLLFNLPGRPKSIRETIDEIWKAVPYCVDLIGGPYLDCNDEVCNAFRPKNARRR